MKIMKKFKTDHKLKFALLFLPLFLIGIITYFISCEQELGDGLDGPLTFKVEISEGEIGSKNSPVPFSKDEIEFSLSVRTIDQDGKTDTGFKGPVNFNIGPTGQLVLRQETSFALKKGVATDIPVKVRYIHGKTHIWVEDVGTKGDPGSYATGLSEEIWFANPSLRNVQEPEKSSDSSLKNEFVEINIGDRILIVTGITNDGFYVTDISEPDGIYNAMYVYAFNRPEKLDVGDRISQLNGTVQEYYGFTELGFPSWTVSERGLQPPDSYFITEAQLNDDDVMESYESRLVHIENGLICETGEDYDSYGQWTVLLSSNGDCESGKAGINVISAFEVPEFDPKEHQGQTMRRLTGNLRYHRYASPNWIIYPRDLSDIEVD